MLPLVHCIKGYMMLMCLIIGDAVFHHLVKVMSVGFLAINYY